MPNPSHVLLTFLQSVGKRQDAEYYLKLFRELPKASFAVIVAEPEVFAEVPSSVVEPLRFLSQLGLFPVVALGALGPPGGNEHLRELLAAERLKVAEASPADARWIDTAKRHLNHNRCVVTDLAVADDDPFTHLERLLVGLGTRKLVVLRSEGGLGAKEVGRLALTPNHHLVTGHSGISVINLRSDLPHVQQGNVLREDERQLLQRISALHAACPGLVTSVASPLNLLRELFTVKGAGTLIKTGSNIEHFDSYVGLDRPRLVTLLQDTFGRSLAADFLDREPEDVYLEADYRGVAIVVAGAGAAFLTKFAVNKRAQGEGIGRDLWEAMLRDHRRIYWRARPDNPAVGWYQSECDGMQRTEDWLVFWKGVSPADVPGLIADAVARRPDFSNREASSTTPDQVSD